MAVELRLFYIHRYMAYNSITDLLFAENDTVGDEKVGERDGGVYHFLYSTKNLTRLLCYGKKTTSPSTLLQGHFPTSHLQIHTNLQYIKQSKAFWDFQSARIPRNLQFGACNVATLSSS